MAFDDLAIGAGEYVVALVSDTYEEGGALEYARRTAAEVNGAAHIVHSNAAVGAGVHYRSEGAGVAAPDSFRVSRVSALFSSVPCASFRGVGVPVNRAPAEAAKGVLKRVSGYVVGPREGADAGPNGALAAGLEAALQTFQSEADAARGSHFAEEACGQAFAAELLLLASSRAFCEGAVLAVESGNAVFADVGVVAVEIRLQAVRCYAHDCGQCIFVSANFCARERNGTVESEAGRGVSQAGDAECCEQNSFHVNPREKMIGKKSLLRCVLTLVDFISQYTISWNFTHLV